LTIQKQAMAFVLLCTVVLTGLAFPAAAAPVDQKDAVALEVMHEVNELHKRTASVLASLEGGKGSPLFLSARYQIALDSDQAVAEYGPFQGNYAFTQAGDHTVRLSTEVTLTATYISDDVGQYSAMGGYRKLYASNATEQLSVVDDDARLKLRIETPARVQEGETFKLTAVPYDTNVPLNLVKIA
jgi:hypothetical protein